MAKISLDELRADRDAGTGGPWRVRAGHRHDPEECNLHICGDIFVLADINGPNYSHQEPNARRIARLPDLEVAFLEAVDTLRVIAAEAYVAVDEGYPGTWRNVAVECIDIARAFLERNT